MAKANQVEFRMRKLDPDKCILTVNLDIREIRVRMAIGLWLIKLGCRVIGLGVKVEPLEPMPLGTIEVNR